MPARYTYVGFSALDRERDRIDIATECTLGIGVTSVKTTTTMLHPQSTTRRYTRRDVPYDLRKEVVVADVYEIRTVLGGAQDATRRL